MLKKNSVLCIYSSIILIVFAGSGCNVKLGLKIPNGYYYSHNYREDKAIKFMVSSILPEAIYIFSGEDKFKKILSEKDQSIVLKKDENKYLLGMPTLYDIKPNPSQNALTYYFGKEGSDNNLAAAIVNVAYNTPASPASEPITTTETVNIKLKKSKIESSKPEEFLQRNSPYKNDNYLKILADINNKATISIDYSHERGKVMVCIINAKTGLIEASLNPKVQNGMSFISEMDVFIIPIIIPSKDPFTGEIKFEVGDPKVNGSVSVTEELS